MYIFIFMVHLFGLWVLEIYVQWKKCTSLLFVFQFFFLLLLFSFLGQLCIFLSVCYSLLDCSDQMSCLCTEGKGF